MKRQRLVIDVTCRAIVTERWVVMATPRRAAWILAEPQRALDALAGDGLEVLSTVNTGVYDEEDRFVDEVRRDDDGSIDPGKEVIQS